jgi:hypothetical protein
MWSFSDTLPRRDGAVGSGRDSGVLEEEVDMKERNQVFWAPKHSSDGVERLFGSKVVMHRLTL